MPEFWPDGRLKNATNDLFVMETFRGVVVGIKQAPEVGPADSTTPSDDQGLLLIHFDRRGVEVDRYVFAGASGSGHDASASGTTAAERAPAAAARSAADARCARRPVPASRCANETATGTAGPRPQAERGGQRRCRRPRRHRAARTLQRWETPNTKGYGPTVRSQLACQVSASARTRKPSYHSAST